MSENETTTDVVENPTIEAPVVEPPKPPEIDKDALISELTKMGVRDPNELVNMQRASREAGNIANLLGQVRTENQELKRMIQQMQSSQNQQVGYQDAQPVDIGKVVRHEVENVVKSLTTEQIRAQEALEGELSEIEMDDDYQMVASVWQQYLGSRPVQLNLRKGATTLTKEYNKVVKAFYKKMLGAQQSAINLAQKGVKTPHVEAASTHTPQLPKQTEEKERKINQLREAHQKGTMTSDTMLDNLVKSILPADDPLWRVK